MPATVILNPYSNRWEAGRRAPEVEAAVRDAGIEFEFLTMQHPGHGIELARLAAEAGNLPLIAAGGDGGLSEVVNGLLQATPAESLPAGPIGLLPLGTANDLTDCLGIPRDLKEAAMVIREGYTRTIDLGMVNGRYFGNNSAVGLEPCVTLENIRLTWLRGVIRYLVAAVIAILKRPTWNVRLEWDDGEYEGSIALISVGNSHRTGGVFYMTPEAIMDDGMLDFIYAPALGRIRLLQLLPKAQTGEHIHEVEVSQKRAKQIKIRTTPTTPIQADGEIVTNEANEIHYQVLPRALSVFTPAAQD